MKMIPALINGRAALVRAEAIVSIVDRADGFAQINLPGGSWGISTWKVLDDSLGGDVIGHPVVACLEMLGRDDGRMVEASRDAQNASVFISQ